jgi:protein TonB
LAKESTPLPEEVANRLQELPKKEERKEKPKQEEREKYTIAERPLPTLKELLPPITWAPSDRIDNKEEALPLDTKEPKYISYFASIKRAIELVWEYPEPALRYGIQGKLILEFTILGNGHLEEMHLVRSSGFSVLDQEAIRAVKAASPFNPIPAAIGKGRLDILASFEYHDNRLKYGFVP